MAEVERRRRRLRRPPSSQPPSSGQAAASSQPPSSGQAAASGQPAASRKPAAPSGPAPSTASGVAPVRRPDRSPVPGPPPSAQTSQVHDPEVNQPTSGAGGGIGDERETERGLRGLVGSGSSQVSLSGALRARDAARPDDADMAAAERDLMIVRRGWVPREDLPRSVSR